MDGYVKDQKCVKEQVENCYWTPEVFFSIWLFMLVAVILLAMMARLVFFAPALDKRNPEFKKWSEAGSSYEESNGQNQISTCEKLRRKKDGANLMPLWVDGVVILVWSLIMTLVEVGIPGPMPWVVALMFFPFQTHVVRKYHKQSIKNWEDALKNSSEEKVVKIEVIALPAKDSSETNVGNSSSRGETASGNIKDVSKNAGFYSIRVIICEYYRILLRCSMFSFLFQIIRLCVMFSRR